MTGGDQGFAPVAGDLVYEPKGQSLVFRSPQHHSDRSKVVRTPSTPILVHGAAAVHEQGLACDEVAFAGGEKKDCAAQIIRSLKPP
jgi:hypothetical protein